MNNVNKSNGKNQSYLIIAIWTLIKIVSVIQIDSWLSSLGVNRPLIQIIQSQTLIWIMGVGAIYAIFYFLRTYDWFRNWSIKSVSINLLLLALFGFLVPIGPSIVYIYWSDLPLNYNNLIDVYQNGTASILKDVALHYFLILSLSYGLYFYSEKKQSEVHTALLREDLIQAKLDLLQSQLQPHFLFNSLHNVSSLMEENVKYAQNVLVNLSDLLRQSLEYQQLKYITLKEELQTLDMYLSIQTIRFSDSVEIRKHINDDVWGALIPPFILQPLVENTFKHGLDKQLILEIRATMVNNYLELVIQDNGTGFAIYTEGKGIRNVRTRLDALYHSNNYLFEVTSNTNGVKNLMRVPFKLQKI